MTEFTECVIFGITQATVWITDTLIECTFDPQDFAPFAYSGDRLPVTLLERSLYPNLELDFSLLLTN